MPNTFKITNLPSPNDLATTDKKLCTFERRDRPVGLLPSHVSRTNLEILSFYGSETGLLTVFGISQPFANAIGLVRRGGARLYQHTFCLTP